MRNLLRFLLVLAGIYRLMFRAVADDLLVLARIKRRDPWSGEARR